MSWKESDCVSERLEFVQLASAEGVNFSALCQRFGVSRKTGYKWPELEFLGFCVRGRYFRIRMSDKSLQRFKRRIRELTGRS